jgi:hypothetical protein
LNHLDEHADTRPLAAREEEPEPARVWQRALVAGVSVFVLGGLGPGLYIALTSSRSSRPPMSPSQATAPAVVAQPSGSPVTGTADLRAILPPATVPPVSNECTLPVTFDSDGNVSPLTCAGGGVNRTAWNWYASGGTSTLVNSELLRLGLYATPGQAYQAMCYDYANVYKTKPITERAEEIAQTYYGWQFAGDNPLQDFEQLGCPRPS